MSPFWTYTPGEGKWMPICFMWSWNFRFSLKTIACDCFQIEMKMISVGNQFP